MKEQKWIVTAVNNLTGEREAVSRPQSRWKAEELLMKARRYARRKQNTCYHRFRAERLVEQEGMLFCPPLKISLSVCIGCISVSGCVYFSAPD